MNCNGSQWENLHRDHGSEKVKTSLMLFYTLQTSHKIYENCSCHSTEIKRYPFQKWLPFQFFFTKLIWWQKKILYLILWKVHGFVWKVMLQSYLTHSYGESLTLACKQSQTVPHNFIITTCTRTNLFSDWSIALHLLMVLQFYFVIWFCCQLIVSQQPVLKWALPI